MHNEDFRKPIIYQGDFPPGTTCKYLVNITSKKFVDLVLESRSINDSFIHGQIAFSFRSFEITYGILKNKNPENNRFGFIS